MPADSFESPLTLAACGGHVELAMLLLERGANIEEVSQCMPLPDLGLQIRNRNFFFAGSGFLHFKCAFHHVFCEWFLGFLTSTYHTE
jgi:ankyrin repeat protein